MILYPKDWIEPGTVAPSLPTDADIKTRIKALVATKPMHDCDIIVALQAYYNARNQHIPNEKYLKLVQDVDVEFRPVQAIEP